MVVVVEVAVVTEVVAATSENSSSGGGNTGEEFEVTFKILPYCVQSINLIHVRIPLTLSYFHRTERIARIRYEDREKHLKEILKLTTSSHHHPSLINTPLGPTPTRMGLRSIEPFHALYSSQARDLPESGVIIISSFVVMQKF